MEMSHGCGGTSWGALPDYYHQQNAGKRNICVDLRQRQAKALVLELVAEADILIENYRPDVMPRLGLGFDVLSQVNPRLIMLSISGVWSWRSGIPSARICAHCAC